MNELNLKLHAHAYINGHISVKVEYIVVAQLVVTKQEDGKCLVFWYVLLVLFIDQTCIFNVLSYMYIFAGNFHRECFSYTCLFHLPFPIINYCVVASMRFLSLVMDHFMVVQVITPSWVLHSRYC